MTVETASSISLVNVICFDMLASMAAAWLPVMRWAVIVAVVVVSLMDNTNSFGFSVRHFRCIREGSNAKP